MVESGRTMCRLYYISAVPDYHFRRSADSTTNYPARMRSGRRRHKNRQITRFAHGSDV